MSQKKLSARYEPRSGGRVVLDGQHVTWQEFLAPLRDLEARLEAAEQERNELYARLQVGPWTAGSELDARIEELKWARKSLAFGKGYWGSIGAVEGAIEARLAELKAKKVGG